MTTIVSSQVTFYHQSDVIPLSHASHTLPYRNSITTAASKRPYRRSLSFPPFFLSLFTLSYPLSFPSLRHVCSGCLSTPGRSPLQRKLRHSANTVKTVRMISHNTIHRHRHRYDSPLWLNFSYYFFTFPSLHIGILLTHAAATSFVSASRFPRLFSISKSDCGGFRDNARF